MLDQDLSDLNLHVKKGGEESTHSVTNCLLLSFVSLGVATTPLQPDLPDALERLVGLPERHRPLVATPPAVPRHQSGRKARGAGTKKTCRLLSVDLN